MLRKSLYWWELWIILVVFAVTSCVSTQVRSVSGGGYISDPEFLRLRTELVKLHQTGYEQVTDTEYEWKEDPEKIRKCLDLAERVHKEYPSDPYVAGLLAEFRMQIEDPEMVLAGYVSAASSDAGDPVRHYALYRAYVQKYTTDDCPTDPQEYEQRREEFKAVALPSIRRAIELDPACCLFRIKEFVATTSCRSATAISEGLEIIGLIPEDLPRTEDPVNCFNEEWRFQYQIATNLHSAGRYEESIQLLEDLVERWELEEWDPDLYFHRVFSQVYNNLGVCYTKVGRKEEALAAYEYALRLNPRSSMAAFNLVRQCVVDGEYEKALEYLADAPFLKEDKPELAWEMLARAKYEIGDRQGAVEAARKTLDLNPENETARLLLERLHETGNDSADSSPRQGE